MTKQQIARFIQWRVYDGLSLKEIAQRLQCTPMEVLELEEAQQERIRAEWKIRLDSILHDQGVDRNHRRM